MRRRLVLLLFASACADILGIDDGKPRTYEDASIPDASADVTTLPDVKPEALADVAPDVPTSPLECGDASCNAITQACCRTGDPVDASTQSFACITAAATCSGLKVTCSDNANCAAQGNVGLECCAEVDGGTVATTTACAKPGTCSGAPMCQPGDDENCTGDSGCKPSTQTIIGWTICK
jgi:hypothetical protein